MVAPVNNLDPKILRERSAKLRWAGGASAVCMWSSGVKKAFDVGGPSWIDFIYFWGRMRRGGRAAPYFGVAMSSKRRVRAAHGRARAAKTH
jgi:hypothetical protein